MQENIDRKKVWLRKPWEVYGVSRTTWWRWEQQGRIPRGHRIGPQTVIWNAEETERKLIGQSREAG